MVLQFRNYKIVYRRYAGLFFCLCVDANDNELAYLEAIHLFVEVLGEAIARLAWSSFVIGGSQIPSSTMSASWILSSTFTRCATSDIQNCRHLNNGLGLCHPRRNIPRWRSRGDE